MNTDFNNYIKQLQGNERKVFEQLVKDINNNIPNKKDRLPKPLSPQWKVPDDNFRLYNLMKRDDREMPSVSRKWNGGGYTFEVTKGYSDSKIETILKEYESISSMVIKDITDKNLTLEQGWKSIETRVINPMLKEIEDYYVADLPGRITNAISNAYKKPDNVSTIQGKSEDVIEQVKKQYSRDDIVKIEGKAADWMTLDIWRDPNNNYVHTNHEVGYDTKLSYVTSFKPGARVSNPTEVAEIMSNSGLNNLVNKLGNRVFSDTQMEKYYNYYILGKDKEGKQMDTIPGAAKFGEDMTKAILNTPALTENIGVAYLQYEYGGWQGAQASSPFSAMFFTTKNGLFSLSQLLEYYNFSIDPEGIEARDILASKMEEWHASNNYAKALTSDSYVWAKYIKGYIKGAK